MIVLVAGLPGSGKSFFSEQLAAIIKAAYLNSDQIRREMNAAGSYSFSDKLFIYREMLRRTELIAIEKRDIVVDATFFNHTMRDMFLTMAREHDIPVCVIEVTASESVIRERLKHPRKFSEANFSVYENVRDHFEEITRPHLILESTNENIKEMLATAKKYLKP